MKAKRRKNRSPAACMRFKRLVRKIGPKNRYREVDFGRPVGREVL